MWVNGKKVSLFHKFLSFNYIIKNFMCTKKVSDLHLTKPLVNNTFDQEVQFFCEKPSVSFLRFFWNFWLKGWPQQFCSKVTQTGVFPTVLLAAPIQTKPRRFAFPSPVLLRCAELKRATPALDLLWRSTTAANPWQALIAPSNECVLQIDTQLTSVQET